MVTLNNTILEIRPYWNGYTWVFNDDRVNLVEEPFVAGVPEMINEMVREIPNAYKGFRLTMSEYPFPTHTHEIKKTKAEGGGNWYKMEQAPYLEGWLCPALFKYFPYAPESIYLKADILIEKKPWWRVW